MSKSLKSLVLLGLRLRGAKPGGGSKVESLRKFSNPSIVDHKCNSIAYI